MKPLVSVLVPIYNAEPFLNECLHSIIHQTYKQIQIVLVDDGSTDDSLSICQKYALIDGRIQVFHKENSGVAATRNELLSHVNGEFFLFVDADDWIEWNMIEVLLSLYNATTADIVCCGFTSSPKKTVQDLISIRTKEWERITIIEKFLYHKDFRGTLWNKLFRARLLDKVQFNPEISYGEDALFCWHLLNRVDKVVITTHTLYHYRMNEGSISHTSFSDRKMSAHYVWEQICSETRIKYPNFLNIAEARHCIEDTLLLRNAAHSGYNNKQNIALLQLTIRKKWIFLNKVNISSLKMKLFALLSSRSYYLAGVF